MSIPKYLREKHISAVSTHKNADADTMFSALVVSYYHRIPIITHNPTPLAMLINDMTNINTEIVDFADSIIVVDENRRGNLPVIPSHVDLIIDHHKYGKDSISADNLIILPDAPTTSYILKQLGYPVDICPLCYALTIADDTAFLTIAPEIPSITKLWEEEFENALIKAKVTKRDLIDIYDHHPYYDIRIYKGYKIGQLRTYGNIKIEDITDDLDNADVIIQGVISKNKTYVYTPNKVFKSIGGTYHRILSRKRDIYKMIDEIIN